jgi:hypothetical protein
MFWVSELSDVGKLDGPTCPLANRLLTRNDLVSKTVLRFREEENIVPYIVPKPLRN